MESFLQFGLSEFLLIAVWTWFKAPDDFFSIYNILPIRKFSVFQKFSAEGKNSGDSLSDTKKMSFAQGREDTGEEDEGHRHLGGSLMSEDNPNLNEDYQRKSTLEKRSI